MNHLDKDLLDRFALCQITDEAELAVIEEHLLVCEICRSEVVLVDAIRNSLQGARRRAEN
jgi:hypothetical protein